LRDLLETNLNTPSENARITAKMEARRADFFHLQGFTTASCVGLKP
jgi:hypothetical protein